MVIAIKNIINSSNAISQSDGFLLFKHLEANNLDNVAIDFSGIDYLSSAFLNASIGKIALLHPEIVKKLDYKIPDSRAIFRSKINQVIENALLGDCFDNLVKEA